MRDHFFHLINKDETILEKCGKRIPLLLKFFEAEAEKERKDIDLQMRLKTIIRKNKIRSDNNNAFLTIILCCMAIVKENSDRMIITLEVNINIHLYVIGFFYTLIEILSIF